MKLNEFKVGDLVKLDCPKLFQNMREDKFIGYIVDIFDLLSPSGKENLEIRLKNKTTYICWKPNMDDGTLTLIERKQ